MVSFISFAARSSPFLLHRGGWFLAAYNDVILSMCRLRCSCMMTLETCHQSSWDGSWNLDNSKTILRSPSSRRQRSGEIDWKNVMPWDRPLIVNQQIFVMRNEWCTLIPARSELTQGEQDRQKTERNYSIRSTLVVYPPNFSPCVRHIRIRRTWTRDWELSGWHMTRRSLREWDKFVHWPSPLVLSRSSRHLNNTVQALEHPNASITNDG
jgi:hypothetical protein